MVLSALSAIQIVSLLLDAADKGASFVSKVIADAKQAGELTDEQAAAFEKDMQERFGTRAWKTDKQLSDAGLPTQPEASLPPLTDDAKLPPSGT